MANVYSEDDIKRKIRKLKKLEIKIRFADNIYADRRLAQNFRDSDLVWHKFFSCNSQPSSPAKYTLKQLAAMDKTALTDVINEFFWNVYYKSYQETGLINQHVYDPDILRQMGLPCTADSQEIKTKFRHLAKQYHPDTGGDSKKFIGLLDNYRKLTKNNLK